MTYILDQVLAPHGDENANQEMNNLKKRFDKLDAGYEKIGRVKDDTKIFHQSN